MGKLGKVLVIDDDEIVRFIATDLIREIGFAEQVIEASDGMQGLKYLIDNCFGNNDCPELILLDINMPEIDGFQFLNLKQTLPETKELPSKIIMVSSSSREDEIKKAKELGAAGFIVKPLTEEKIIKAFQSFL